MRLNWFSPLPPAKTDIAHFTARVLPALSALAEVVLWTDQERWSPELETYGEVRRFISGDIRWENLTQADVTFYNIGNNGRFHSGIWEVSRLHPGVVILHDLCLHDLFSYLFRVIKKDKAGYIELLESFYGRKAARDGLLFWEGMLGDRQMAEAYSYTAPVLDPALGAIVHSEVNSEAVNSEMARVLESGSCPLFYIPLPYEARGAGFSLQRGLQSPPPYRLVLFGYLGPNRCVDTILNALHEFKNDGSDQRRLFELHIYGELSDPHAASRLISSLGLQSQVKIHGFVSEQELAEGLDAAHLALNLRYPTMGEASGTQLRIWSHALPSLVTRIGWYGQLPADTVAFVEPDSMVEGIQAHLRRFVENPASFVELGQKGHQRLVEVHSPEQYAKKVVALASDMAPLRRRWSALTMADRVGDALRPFTSAAIEERVEHFSAEIIRITSSAPRPS